MSEENSFAVSADDAGERLDKLLAARTAHSRAAIQRLIAQERVRVDGRARPAHYALRAGETVTLCEEHMSAQPYALRPESIPLDILYEDGDLLVVNKPKGMVVHPGAGNPTGTLVHALLAHCGDSLSGIGGVLRPGIVHRIDKDTAGLLMVAKNDLAHQSLSAQIASHTFERAYDAVVTGYLREPEGVIDAPVGRDPRNRLRMAVVPNGKPARSHYQTVEVLRGYTRLRVELETGRTHQIRVHMAYRGHPVAGDHLYGARREIFAGQCLFACRLGFVHPRTEEPMCFETQAPGWFADFVAALRG